jgi:hypothetical protein
MPNIAQFPHNLGISFQHNDQNLLRAGFPQKFCISFPFSPLALLYIKFSHAEKKKISLNLLIGSQEKEQTELYKKLILWSIKWINRPFLWTTMRNCVKVAYFSFARIAR